MKLLQAIVLTIFVVCVAAQYAAPKPPPKKKVPEVDQTCMECICQASSNCDTSLKCHNAGGGAYFCGPYVVSWAYWHDGGRPGDKGKAHDFEDCLNNKTCAEKAVRGYMRKYGQDCDGSRVIDCYDFARIHKLGYGQCSSENILHTDYWEKFEACYGYPDGNDGYAQNDNVNNYGQNDRVDNYGQNDNANTYGQNDNANTYGQNDNADNYGQNNDANTYGQNDNANYGQNENADGHYDYGTGQIQARKIHN